MFLKTCNPEWLAEQYGTNIYFEFKFESQLCNIMYGRAMSKKLSVS